MPLLELRDIHKSFHTALGTVLAVRGVDLDIDKGETLGLVGESGSGKSTLARVVASLHRPSSGTINFAGSDITNGISDRITRRRIQMVFQDPSQSLNPRFSVARSLAEPAHLLNIAMGADARPLAEETLRSVGLDPSYMRRRPAELSGGQQQRVAIARALIPGPDLLILDEPTSSLDQPIQTRIVSLLKSIQADQHLAFLFVTHDLRVIRTIAHRIAVMYAGRIVELADTETLFASPRHPYTQALLSAVPGTSGGKRSPISGETPSPSELPQGCAFQSRCPLVHDPCYQIQPHRTAVTPDHFAECFATSAPAKSPSNSADAL